MKKGYRLLVLVVMLLLCSPALFANSVNQDVVITVDSFSLLSLQDATVSFTYSGGGEPVAGSSRYYVSTNNANPKKVSAVLGSEMPTGMTLTANLAAYGAGTSAGAQSLSTVAVDLVTGLTSGSGEYGVSGWIDITYSVTVADSVAPDTYTRTVTYTLTEA